MKNIIRRIDLFFAIIVFAIFSVIIAGRLVLPDSVSTNGSSISFMELFTIDSASASSVGFQANERKSPDSAQLKLLNIIPVKQVDVAVLPAQSVYVSGECFGIKLYTDGVIIVGTKDVVLDGKTYNPARQAGLQKGDIIVSINNIITNTADDVEEILNSSLDEYELKIKRDGEIKIYTLKPVYSAEDDRYKVGLWVRDSTAGVGTITFFNPKNNTVAALGHPINDVDTNELMPMLNGEAVKANVTKIYKSSEGETGSICCDFTNDTIASLTLNSDTGIYGSYSGEISGTQLYPVATAQEIEKGSAKLICTLDDNVTRAYDIEIIKISYKNNEGKNMVIKLTDDELISKTGGIVQGMSGSPIIQNGKLVGALTHVIVDNPLKGYAIFAEKMLAVSNAVD